MRKIQWHRLGSDCYIGLYPGDVVEQAVFQLWRHSDEGDWNASDLYKGQVPDLIGEFPLLRDAKQACQQVVEDRKTGKTWK